MNDKQRKVLITVCVVIVGMLAFPPFHFRFGQGNSKSAGYSFLFDAPAGNTSVDLGLLAMQWAAVLIVGAIAFVVFKDK